MINGVDILDLNRNFTADEWTSLGWNGRQAYVSQAWDSISGRRRGGRGGGCDRNRGYGHGGGPQNFNKLNSNNSGGHDKGQQGGQGQGKGCGAGHDSDKGVRNGTGFGRDDYQ